MTSRQPNFDRYAFSRHPGYVEPATRQAFAKAVPLRTLVVYCYDPRAVGIPAAVAREFGDIYPGEIVRDDSGNKVASTTTLFEVVVAGGRAADALRSVTVAQHLFGIENVVVVHHSHCGATSFTSEGIIGAYRHEHGVDISELYSPQSICISDYVASLRHDTRLIRESLGTPPHVNIYGYFYEIDSDRLTRVVLDPAPIQSRSVLAERIISKPSEQWL